MISLVIIFLSFLVLDLIFFWVNQTFLTKTLVSVQGFKPNVRYVRAFFCYVALTFLMYYFIILPKRSLTDAFLLGIGVYTVYETTNYALFKNWPLKMVVMDILWGGILFFIVALLQNINLKNIKI
jgi:uncharacterized membrane protein